MLILSSPVELIKGAPTALIKKLKRLGINTIGDLFWHLPYRYEDFSKLSPIKDLKIGQSVVIQGLVRKVIMRRSWKRRMFIVEAIITDASGGINAIWFNQPYVAQILTEGKIFNFAGKVLEGESGIYLAHPLYEAHDPTQEARHTRGLVATYPETRGLTSKGIRFLMASALKDLKPVDEFLPAEIIKKHGLFELGRAIRCVHFPRSIDEATAAKERFSIDDLVMLRLFSLQNRIELSKESAPEFKHFKSAIDKFIDALPFKLTNAQKKCWDEISKDLAHTKPMNRLLQGDVGSGKTILAILAAYSAALNKKQVVIVAPTEILSRQHYKNFCKFLKGKASVGLLISKEARIFLDEDLEESIAKVKLKKKLHDGEISVIIGTHALFEADVLFNDVGLVIIDEQHRFGVEQRAALAKKEKNRGNETTVHFLSLSATPIPRTIALALFSDLDLSLLDEMPPGRQFVKTKIVKPQERKAIYQFAHEQIKRGRQAFVICPRIESAQIEVNSSTTVANAESISSKSALSPAEFALLEVKAVKEEYERLSKEIFPDLKVAMLHGKMRSKEKEDVMNKFVNREIDVLVSTSVVEVGIDVPNATIMMIEGVERFGLAQLYQFRGRVGRGEHQSYAFLFTNSYSQDVLARLNALLSAKNGFELAEKDLEIRGPGEVLGEKQSGYPDLVMKSLSNAKLVQKAKEIVDDILRTDNALEATPSIKQKLEEFKQKIHLE